MVRLILLERIYGVPMREIEHRTLSREERQEFLKQIIDVECPLYTRNLVHRNFRPRNIMVIKDGDQTAARIILLDFGQVEFGRSRNPDDRQQERRRLPGSPISPLLRWNIYYCRPDNFWHWIDWNWQPWLEKEYKETEATITGAKGSHSVTDSNVKHYEPIWPCPDEY